MFNLFKENMLRHHFVFFTVKRYFAELFYTNLSATFFSKNLSNRMLTSGWGCKRILFLDPMSAYAILGSLSKLIFDLLKTRSMLFFLSTAHEALSPDLFYKNMAQGYTDLEGKLWGFTNRVMLNPYTIKRGLEARFQKRSGLIINTSLQLSLSPGLKALLRSENLVASVNLLQNVDYPLLALSKTVEADQFLSLLLQSFGEFFISQKPFFFSSLMLKSCLRYRKQLVAMKKRRILVSKRFGKRRSQYQSHRVQQNQNQSKYSKSNVNVKHMKKRKI